MTGYHYLVVAGFLSAGDEINFKNYWNNHWISDVFLLNLRNLWIVEAF